jgi:hypothetical protein
MATLQQRFEAFIRTLDGFEDIDTLLKGRDLPGKTRADYLLRSRAIIVEQKSLEVDPTTRPQKYADKMMAQGRLIAYGKVSTRMFSEDLQREFMLDLAKNIDAIAAKADRQMEDTRDIFSIPDALGVPGDPEREGRHAGPAGDPLRPGQRLSEKDRRFAALSRQ